MELRFNRIAIKVGSNVLTNKDGSVDDRRIAHIVDQIAALRNNGVEVVLISSGAVAYGRSEITLPPHLDSVSSRQILSAVGQAKLINRYYELFKQHGIFCGQVLTMKENFRPGEQYRNQQACMTVMLETTCCRSSTKTTP
jgi:glutamate 5-kinase